MNGYDERLRQLEMEFDGRTQAQAELNALTAQRQSLEQNVAELDRARRKSQTAVDRLRSHSLKGFVIGLFGHREEALQRACDALTAAVMKWDQAARELEEVATQEQQLRQRIGRMERAAQTYEQLLREKADCIVRSGGMAAAEILALRQRIDRGEAMCRELNEAISAGCQAEPLAERAYDALIDANEWGTVDLIGGLLTDLAKYDAIQAAKQTIEELQDQLELFRTELADVAMDVQAEIKFNGLFQFADIFFDGAITALLAKNRIKRAMDSVKEVQRHIRRALHELETRLHREQAEIANARERLRCRIMQTRI